MYKYNIYKYGNSHFYLYYVFKIKYNSMKDLDIKYKLKTVVN